VLSRSGYWDAAGYDALEPDLLERRPEFAQLDINGDSPLSWAGWHTRPDAILRKLCYGTFHVRSGRNSAFDHGVGWGFMEKDLLGKP
jgi:hypothetical protein